MTDRHQILTVALAADTRSDDVQAITAAISLLQGVIAVEPGTPVNGTDWVERQRIRLELYPKLMEVLLGVKTQ
jgi:hypothetical protein